MLMQRVAVCSVPFAVSVLVAGRSGVGEITAPIQPHSLQVLQCRRYLRHRYLLFDPMLMSNLLRAAQTEVQKCDALSPRIFALLLLLQVWKTALL